MRNDYESLTNDKPALRLSVWTLFLGMSMPAFDFDFGVTGVIQSIPSPTPPLYAGKE